MFQTEAFAVSSSFYRRPCGRTPKQTTNTKTETNRRNETMKPEQMLALLRAIDSHKLIDWRKMPNGRLVRFTNWAKLAK